MSNAVSETTRRNLLALTAVGAAALAVRSAHSASPLDLTDPEQRLRAYMLMRGALDDRLVIGFVSGRYYGVVDDEITPLYGVLGATFARYRRLPDGGYMAATYEVPFFTDLDSGRLLERWRNPYMNEIVDVPQTSYPPSRILFGRDLAMKLATPFPGVTMVDRVWPAEASGDDVWMVEETTNAVQRPGQPKPARYSEIVSLRARRSDLATPDAKRVPCDTAHSSVVSWRPWLKMGDRPGHLMASGNGRYGAALDELPAAWLDIVAARRPALLKDPGAPLAALWDQRS